ncbi:MULTISPECIES: LysR substrate-binding domain-containing protein [unclassified Streptomyces]|uniref:LysR substrate-binding domain-containing protein n=1 Tax=unclassified Streptomyces TaxID=2593676 RepID=UPI0033D122C7
MAEAHWAADLGSSPNVTLETEELHGVPAMIKTGLAVGLIPATLISKEPDRSGAERVVLPPRAAPLHREILAAAQHPPPIISELITPLVNAPQSDRL